jgi:hypothetical protein
MAWTTVVPDMWSLTGDICDQFYLPRFVVTYCYRISPRSRRKCSVLSVRTVDQATLQHEISKNSLHALLIDSEDRGSMFPRKRRWSLRLDGVLSQNIVPLELRVCLMLFSSMKVMVKKWNKLSVLKVLSQNIVPLELRVCLMLFSYIKVMVKKWNKLSVLKVRRLIPEYRTFRTESLFDFFTMTFM